ncbi:hypothetical protein F5877DRAFT_77104 [Lentinula edodes]|nr:hypothetical protein F5877DRAFT_77104 [Lentinula edodes]
MTALPVEIIFAILEHVYYRGNSGRPALILSREPDHKTLSACSLISSTWLAPSRTLLYNHITEYAAPRLMNALKRCRREGWNALMKYVRILDLSLVYQYDMGSSNSYQPAAKDWSDITQYEFELFMNYCSNLYELRIGASGIISLQPILTKLRTSTPPLYPTCLRALHISRCSVQSPILYELLGFFPTVKFLTVEVEIAVHPPTNAASKFQLYELSMYRTLPYEISSWLLSNSRDSLRIVELRDLPSVRVSKLLQEYGPRLHSFRTMKYNIHTAMILRSCTNLRELIFLGLPSVPTLSVRELPPTLEHFSLVHRQSEPSVGIADVLMLVRTLPNLKLLDSDEKLKYDSQFELLEEICTKKGIDIKISEYGHWPNDEPVEASTFPRRLTTLNFRSMNQFQT